MIREEKDGLWIEQSEVIAKHHEEVFACLNSPIGLVRWFPVTAKFEAPAPESGGLIILGWDRAFTRKTTIAILDYDPGGFIAWDWQAGTSDLHAPLYWRITPELEQGALVELRQGPFSDDRETLLIMADQATVWRWHLCNLRTVLEAGYDMRAIRPL